MSNIGSCPVLVTLLLLVAEGHSRCTLNDLTIGTVRTGRVAQGKPEWMVTVYNKCVCCISLLKVRCTGFKSAEPTDPSKILPQGNECLINGGQPVAAGSSISFSYAWDPPFIFWPASATFSRGC